MDHPFAKRGALVVCALLACTVADAAPNSLGQTGLIHMPDGRVSPDGTLRGGLTTMDPYAAVWGSVTLVPWLELSGRYTRIQDVEGFPGLISGFGDYKDKAFDVKFRLLEESEWMPAVSVGIQDFEGTGIFRGRYVAASKRLETPGFGAFDITLGYGQQRFDGVFGGVRWHTPWSDRLALLVEWDSYDYQNDFYAQQTGNVLRDGGLTYGLQFTYHQFHLQLAHQDGELGASVAMSLPLQHRTFVPKTEEPPPVPVELERPPVLDEWQHEPESLQPLSRALAEEGFFEVRLLVDGDTVRLSLGQGRITTIGRAIGRAARLVALHAPPEIRRLELTYVEFRQPLVTYRFDDLALLRGWYAGTVPPEQLQPTLSIAYADARAYDTLAAEGLVWTDIHGPRDGGWLVSTGPVRFGFPITIRRDVDNPATLRIIPARFRFLFNDPDGALKYDLHSLATLSKWLGGGYFATGSLRLTLDENVSGAIAQSNSLLPRVRSESMNYLREGDRLQLNSAYLGHIGNPADRIYTFVSAGIYEQAFAGIGGEVLYLPERGDWAVDFATYGVRQRDFKGHLGFQDYQTIQALGSFHYRVPRYGLTFTTRAGRFLAGDYGARFEVKRRFLSGFELGAWYSYTDAKDITSPGSPESPYRDKGVFLRFAFGPFMPADTSGYAAIALSAWTRDPGQMVRAPGNLYDMYERRLLLNLEDLGPWSDFGY